MEIFTRMKPIALLYIFLLIVIPFLLVMYEEMFLSFYQESVADSWANYFVVPLMIIAIIFDVINNLKKYRSSESQKILKTLKEVLLEAFIIIVFFIYIFRPIISGAIIIINANIGHQSTEIVEGTVTAKIADAGRRSYEFKLTIKTDSNVFEFQTDGKLINSYNEGDAFKETLKKGSLGLLYNH